MGVQNPLKYSKEVHEMIVLFYFLHKVHLFFRLLYLYMDNTVVFSQVKF